MRTGTRRLVAIPLIGLLFACSGGILPAETWPGSTVVIPLGGEEYTDTLFYTGLVEFQAAFDAVEHPGDAQRGAIKIVMCDATLYLTWAECFAPAAPSYELEIRAITRVYPDPASEVGLANTVYGPAFGSPADDPRIDVPMSGQLVAVLKVPTDAVAVFSGPEDTTPRVFDVWAGLLPPGETQVLQSGWDTPWYLRLHNFSAGGTQIQTIFPIYGGMSIFGDWARLTPNPKVVLKLDDPSVAADLAAATVVVSYPSAEVEIAGAFEEKNLGRSSIVRHEVDVANSEVTVHMIAPDRGIGELAIVFRLLGGSPVDSSDFVVSASETRLFNENGAEILDQDFYVAGIR